MGTLRIAVIGNEDLAERYGGAVESDQHSDALYALLAGLGEEAEGTVMALVGGPELAVVAATMPEGTDDAVVVAEWSA